MQMCGKNKHTVRLQMHTDLVADIPSSTLTAVLIISPMVNDALDLNVGYGDTLSSYDVP